MMNLRHLIRIRETASMFPLTLGKLKETPLVHRTQTVCRAMRMRPTSVNVLLGSLTDHDNSIPKLHKVLDDVHHHKVFGTSWWA